MAASPPAAPPAEHLKVAAALEAQRAVLGDPAVDAALAALAAAPARAAPAPTPVESERRQVTILFLDVVGSTRLSQHLDPEDIQFVLDGLLARCTTCIEAHGGRVLQYAGDSILAAFGVARAAEDDAERALLAGLDLLVLGREQGQVVRQRFRQDGFDVRVGAHTGGVLLGGGVDAEGTIRGLAVNVAARLEQLAPPGALRISRETWLHVRGRFELQQQPPLALKGVDAPVVTYLVGRALPRGFRDPRRGIQGLAAPLVGRASELAQLLDAQAAAAAQGRLQALTLVAEAGLGKSRLLAEFEAALPAGVPCWRARAHPHSRQQIFGLVRDLFCRLFDIAESDDQGTARSKLQLGLAPGAGAQADEAAALIGQLIGLDFSTSPHVAGILADARQIRSRAFHLAGALLRRAAAAQPQGLVLLLDDLHWADDASLDFFQAMAEAAAATPVMLLCGTRPQLREHCPAWGRRFAQHQLLELAPLDDRGAALADALLAQVHEPPAALRELLLRQADGNPFYMEELLLMLIDDGVVDTAVQPWSVRLERLGALRVPTTLTGVLQARLDSLPGAERRALQQASVVGSVFWDDALRAAAEPGDAPEQALPGLERRGPVRQRAASVFAGSREYGFRHHLLHQVTYDTVLKRQREGLHHRTAQWLVAAAGERIGEHAALIAQHFECAGDHREAVRYLLRATQAALAGAAPALALEHAERAQRLLPEDDWRGRFDLCRLRCVAYNRLGRRDQQAAGAQEQLRLAERLEDPRCLALAHSEHAMLQAVTADYRACIESARLAREWAARAGEPDLALPSAADTGYALHQLGRHEEAAEQLQQTLALARQYGRSGVEVIALSRLSAVFHGMGRQKDRMDCYDEAIAAADRAGNLRLSAGLRSNLGMAEQEWGNLERSRELLTSALATLRAIGDRASQGYTLWAFVALHVDEGRLMDAIAAGEQALELAVEVRDGGMERGLLIALVCLGAECGAFDRARAWLARHDALATPNGERNPSSLLAGAVLSQHAGEVDAARAQVQAWLQWLGRPDARPSDASISELGHACRVLEACAEKDAHERILARAWRQLKASADELPPSRRHDFIHRVHGNRRIAQAWTAAHPKESPAG